jgi:hypothetical protein
MVLNNWKPIEAAGDRLQQSQGKPMPTVATAAPFNSSCTLQAFGPQRFPNWIGVLDTTPFFFHPKFAKFIQEEENQFLHNDITNSFARITKE